MREKCYTPEYNFPGNLHVYIYIYICVQQNYISEHLVFQMADKNKSFYHLSVYMYTRLHIYIYIYIYICI